MQAEIDRELPAVSRALQIHDMNDLSINSPEGTAEPEEPIFAKEWREFVANCSVDQF